MAWTDLSDVRCGYQVLGRGEPLLLIPGLGTTCNVWDAALPELATRFSVVLVDNRGLGRSAAKRPAESLRDYAADLVELMDYLQLDRAHVLGLSLGGMIARRLAADHPSRIDRLVLVSCTDRCTPYLQQVMRLLGGIVRRFPPEVFARAVETLGTSPDFFDANELQIERRIVGKCGDAGKRAIACQLRCLAREAEEVGEPDPVMAPTLVIAGEHDALVPPCYARAMAERIPGSQFELIDGAGHNPMFECPERVVPLISEFLKETPKGGGRGAIRPQSAAFATTLESH